MAKFHIIKRKNGQYHFNLKSRNGEVILTSESYTNKEGCKKGVEAVKKNSQVEERYEKKTATNGEFYFVLKATNGRVIGVSETYSTESGRNRGINSVMRNAQEAVMMDMTTKVMPSRVKETV